MFDIFSFKSILHKVGMIKRAYDRGVGASYLLFDSWFSHDAILGKIGNIGCHVRCRCKNGRTKYSYTGHRYTAKQLFSKVVRKKMQWVPEADYYAAFVSVSLPQTEHGKLVFCENPKSTINKLIDFIKNNINSAFDSLLTGCAKV